MEVLNGKSTRPIASAVNELPAAPHPAAPLRSFPPPLPFLPTSSPVRPDYTLQQPSEYDRAVVGQGQERVEKRKLPQPLSKKQKAALAAREREREKATALQATSAMEAELRARLLAGRMAAKVVTQACGGERTEEHRRRAESEPPVASTSAIPIPAGPPPLEPTSTSDKVQEVIGKIVAARLGMDVLGPVLGLLTRILVDVLEFERVRASLREMGEVRMTLDDIWARPIELARCLRPAGLKLAQLASIDSLDTNFEQVLRLLKNLGRYVVERPAVVEPARALPPSEIPVSLPASPVIPTTTQDSTQEAVSPIIVSPPVEVADPVPVASTSAPELPEESPQQPASPVASSSTMSISSADGMPEKPTRPQLDAADESDDIIIIDPLPRARIVHPVPPRPLPSKPVPLPPLPSKSLPQRPVVSSQSLVTTRDESRVSKRPRQRSQSPPLLPRAQSPVRGTNPPRRKDASPPPPPAPIPIPIPKATPTGPRQNGRPYISGSPDQPRSSLPALSSYSQLPPSQPRAMYRDQQQQQQQRRADPDRESSEGGRKVAPFATERQGGDRRDSREKERRDWRESERRDSRESERGRRGGGRSRSRSPVRS